jgi:hypothetical protein
MFPIAWSSKLGSVGRDLKKKKKLKLLSNFSKDVDNDSALKVWISGEWLHFSFHMERTIDVPSIIGLLNH